jgi:hypothetical protein
VQVVVVTWAAKSAARTEALWALIGEHVVGWADAGWGGYAMPELALFVTQRLTKDEAAASMAPLLAHAEAMKEEGVEGAMAMAMEFPTYLPFFTSFMTDAGGNAGAGVRFSSLSISLYIPFPFCLSLLYPSSPSFPFVFRAMHPC